MVPIRDSYGSSKGTEEAAIDGTNQMFEWFFKGTEEAATDGTSQRFLRFFKGTEEAAIDVTNQRFPRFFKGTEVAATMIPVRGSYGPSKGLRGSYWWNQSKVSMVLQRD